MSEKKKSVIVFFDDSNPKSEIIREIIGERGFADVVVKRKRLENYYRESLSCVYENFSWQVLKNNFELNSILEKFKNIENDDVHILHCFSNFVFSEKEKALLCFEKIFYIDSTFKVISNEKCAALMFNSAKSYLSFLNDSLQKKSTAFAAHEIDEWFKIEGLSDISSSENFIQYITGKFDARYFNSIAGDEYIVTKTSFDKKKILAEYSFYHFLPEDMKPWFVLPYNYVETDSSASYTMERLHITDLAIKYVHGSFSQDEFNVLMSKYFYFFKCRHTKEVSKEEYKIKSDLLYKEKILQRVDKLKSMPQFEKIRDFIFCGTKEKSVDAIMQKYFAIKENIEAKVKFPCVSVIGHGDPCFANSLYSKSSRILKFIDPKGALTKEELWTNPYYDVAKLSHSVCGLYDFFNNALFEISVGSGFVCNLQIDFDNSNYKKIFKEKCEENGFDYLAVRLYEASLFISMLPLHIDYPHKVFGFVLNVIRILEEIENA